MKRDGRPLRRRLGSGQSMIEFALVTPILVMFVVIVADFAWISTDTLQWRQLEGSGVRP